MMELVAEQLNEAMQQQNPKSEVNLFNAFVKGDTEAEVRKKLGLTAHDQDFEYVEYQPITSPVTKILGVRKSKLKKVLEQHEQFFIVDDVYSTGATIDAIKKLMIKVGGQSAREKIQTVTLAREVDAEKFEQQSLSESGVHSVIKIPTELVD
jgi:adenine/guanine phosphoribosyltransferase-like PRPP-binding protein